MNFLYQKHLIEINMLFTMKHVIKLKIRTYHD